MFIILQTSNVILCLSFVASPQHVISEIFINVLPDLFPACIYINEDKKVLLNYLECKWNKINEDVSQPSCCLPKTEVRFE